MNFLLQSFNMIDLFQSPITFYFHSQEKISTPMGKILSILIYITLIFYFFTSDMWNKTNPKISDLTLPNKETKIILNHDILKLEMALFDENRHFISFDPSYFSVKLRMNWKHPNDDKDMWEASNYVEMDTIPCNASFEGYPCDTCLCLDNSSLLNLNITQKNAWNEFSYFEIYINSCSNDSSKNIICHQYERILDYVHGKYFVLSFQQYFFDLNDYENPVRIDFQRSKELYINKNLYQTISFSLMESYLYDDSNIFTENDVKINKLYQEDNSLEITNILIITDDTLKSKNSTTFIFIQIIPSINRREITRKYEKLVDVCSKMGGLAGFLKFFGFMIANFFRHINILQTLSKEKTSILKKNSQSENHEKNNNDEISDENNKINVNLSYSLKSAGIFSRNQMEIENENANKHFQKEIKSPGNKIKRTDTKPKNNPKFVFKIITFCAYIKYIIFQTFRIKFNEDCENINRFEMSFKNEFDILLILRKLQEIEKLKMILFNKRQRNMLDSIHPYKIDSNEEVINVFKLDKDNSYL